MRALGIDNWMSPMIDKPVIGYDNFEKSSLNIFCWEKDEIWTNEKIICPYCNSGKNIKSNLFREYPDDPYGWKSNLDPSEDILITCQCGWWKASNDLYGSYRETTVPALSGVAKNFHVGDVETPIELLRKYLADNNKDLSLINPNSFERLMKDCLKDAYAPCEVIHVGGVGDRGIDLKLILSDKETYLVQVKRRAKLDSSEGVDVVRTLNGVLFRENNPKGMVITTARKFTNAAYEETKVDSKLSIPYDMKLLAFSEVINMLSLKPSTPYKPWTKGIKIKIKEEDMQSQKN